MLCCMHTSQSIVYHVLHIITGVCRALHTADSAVPLCHEMWSQYAMGSLQTQH